MTEQIKDEVTGLVRSIKLVKKTLSVDDGDLLIDALIEELGKLKSNNVGRWIIRSNGKGAFATNWAECSVCHVCGSPQWKRCPVCETRMVVAEDA